MQSKNLSDGLAELARANERKRDAALLRATTELFVLDVIHDRDEIRRYEELATHFLPKVGVTDRLFVSERLAICADAPLAALQMLARDTIEVAAPVLQHSTALGPVDLLSVVAAGGVEHHRLIARRTGLTSEVTRALRLLGDPEVNASLDSSLSVRATPTERAIDTSAADPDIALTRTDRFDPWRFHALDRPARLRLIASVAAEPAAHAITANAPRVDRAFRSILSAAQIVGYARGGQLAPIIATMADGLDLPPSLIAASINDKGGELLAIMLKALRLDENQARQVFLLASPSGRSVQQFFPLSDLYAGMEPSVAESIVEGWRDSIAAGKTRHEQHLAENGDRRRGATGQPARQSTQTPDVQQKRA